MIYHVKKFKNGKIKIELPKNDYIYREDGKILENFYHNEITMHDLSLESINGYTYLVDSSNEKLYDLSLYNVIFLDEFLSLFNDKEKIYLYPTDKRIKKDLMEDLCNGY